MPRPRLRPMTSRDVAPATAAILADDWGDRRAWFRFVVSHPGCTAIVADADGEVVGTGVTTMNGHVAWIGTIWVASSWRGGGVGKALTQATVEAAERANARTLCLVATESGRPLYERLGFERRATYRMFEAPGRGVGGDTASRGDAERSVRAFRPDDLPTLIALDAAATGEDRSGLLAAFASPTTAEVVTGIDDVPRGFLVRPPFRGGATIAADPDDAMALLERRRDDRPTDQTVRSGVVMTNEAGMERLSTAGWTPSWKAPRLERGDPLDWDPNAIWGQFSHATG